MKTFCFQKNMALFLFIISVNLVYNYDEFGTDKIGSWAVLSDNSFACTIGYAYCHNDIMINYKYE